ncbi:hypothetical protein [Hyphococcus sp.]|uniref:hypothetical protein n=1 Tax=Hyphococcus sp. TaxID=2038636 RepID=UPI0020837CDE|nr:MAG: hypothetical protein DHS20C04_24200 [Marinicaulis sp.]
MKWLVGLSAAQTVLLAFVGMRVVALEMRADDIADAADAARLAAQQSAQSRGPTTTLLTPANTTGAVIDMDALRAVIREEIAPVITAQTKAAAQPVSTAPVLSPAQIKRVEADFARDLNLARSRGQSSEAEISNLYAQIAKMPPQARQAALSQLAKAISSGDIDARL